MNSSRLASTAFGAILFFTLRLFCAAPFYAQQESASRLDQARKWLNDGVQAYKKGQTDEAIADFSRAKELDPALINARLYLATAYASLYVPGAPNPENRENGEKALQEFQDILATYPDNKTAIDGAASVLYNLAGTPFSVEKMEESKSYHRKHIELAPNDPEPYYWIGVIDWSIAFRTNRLLRQEWSQKNSQPLDPENPLPEDVRDQFNLKCSATVQEGMEALKKAIALKPDYDEAMAYLNLLYRQKADMESNEAARDEDAKSADDLVEKVKTIKQKQLEKADESQ
jgi:tetratricopeptide (TPR) repeat protein